MTKRHVHTGAYTKHHQKAQPINPIPSTETNDTKRLIEFKLDVQHFNEIANKFTEIAKKFADMTVKCLWVVYSAITRNYVAILFILGVFVLSMLLPDISQKLHKNSELKTMKNVIHYMKDEVNRAEVACLAATEEMCCLHCAFSDEETETTQELRNLSVCTSRGLHTTQSEPVQVEKKIGFFRRFFALSRNVSKKEIAIMSILYTDSFDSQKRLEDVLA